MADNLEIQIANYLKEKANSAQQSDKAFLDLRLLRRKIANAQPKDTANDKVDKFGKATNIANRWLYWNFISTSFNMQTDPQIDQFIHSVADIDDEGNFPDKNTGSYITEENTDSTLSKADNDLQGLDLTKMDTSSQTNFNNWFRGLSKSVRKVVEASIRDALIGKTDKDWSKTPGGTVNIFDSDFPKKSLDGLLYKPAVNNQETQSTDSNTEVSEDTQVSETPVKADSNEQPDISKLPPAVKAKVEARKKAGITTNLATENIPEYAETISVQTKLRIAGFYKGKVDGIWGPQTEAAFKAWVGKDENKNSKLLEEGDVAYMGVMYSSAYTSAYTGNEDKAKITKIQDFLKAQSQRSTDANGNYDEATKNEVLAFQKKYNQDNKGNADFKPILEDGIWGPQTSIAAKKTDENFTLVGA